MFWRISTIAFFGLLSGMFGIWAGDRRPPIRVEGVDLLTPKVAPGGELRIRYRVNRERACGTRVQKILMDSTGKFETSEEIEILSVLRPLGYDAYTSSTLIPKNFEQGMATYRSARSYECNILHTIWPIIVLVADVRFQVEGTPAAEPVEVVPRR